MLRNELLVEFDKDLGKEVLDSLESICKSFSITPEDLFFKWESFSFTLPDEPSLPTLQTAQQFRSYLQLKMEGQGKSGNSRILNKKSLNDIIANRPKLLPRDMNSRIIPPAVTPVKSKKMIYDKSIDDLSSPG